MKTNSMPLLLASIAAFAMTMTGYERLRQTAIARFGSSDNSYVGERIRVKTFWVSGSTGLSLEFSCAKPLRLLMCSLLVARS